MINEEELKRSFRQVRNDIEALRENQDLSLKCSTLLESAQEDLFKIIVLNRKDITKLAEKINSKPKKKTGRRKTEKYHIDKIKRLLKDNSVAWFTAKEISNKLDIHYTTVWSNLRTLVKRDLVEKDGLYYRWLK